MARGYQRAEQPFRLSSGGWSHDYVDGKYALCSGQALRTASEAVLEVVGGGFDVVGGPSMGADALAHGVSLVSGAGWFSVRKEAKGHGRESWLEGWRLQGGERVVVVEDVSTTGKSLLRAVERIEAFGVEIVAAVALLDRAPAVRANIEGRGLRWEPLLTWEDLGIEPL